MATAKKTAEKETKTTKTAAKAKTEAKAETKTTKATKVKEPEINVTIQYQGRDVSVADIVNTIKNNANVETLEKIDVYVQPEKNCAYFVVNGTPYNEPVEF